MKWRVGFFILFLFQIACNNKYDNSNLSIFKYNESASISTLDPAFSKDQAINWATSQIFNSLVKMDVNLNVQTSIAKSWKISEDGKIYTFHLRNDVVFHDHELFENGKGRMVIASDFEYSFNRLISKDLAAPGNWVFSNVETFKSLNDSTFQIQLTNPFPPFLGLLSMQYCSVLPKEIVENTDFRSHPIGTGPFKFQYWKEGVKLVLRKNQNYFETDNGKQLPYLDAVSITFVKDKQSAFLRFIQGELDFISGLDPSYKDEILTQDGVLQAKYSDKINLQSLPYLNTEYLGFLMEGESEISKNVKVRQAINFGFDRKKMLKYLRNNIGTPANHGFVPKGLPSFSENVIGYDYNPEKAKKLLMEAGFPNGEGLETIILSTTSSYLDLCEFIQSQLNEIGISVEVQVNPPSTHRQMVATSKLDFFRGSWIADYPDAENYLALSYSKNFCPNGPNYTHFYNEEFDKLYEESVKTTSNTDRYILYNKMDQMIMDNAAIVPLYYDRVLRFSSKNIINFKSNSQNLLDLSRVRKE